MKNETAMTSPTRLVGQSLLEKIETLRAEGVSNTEIIIGCGYVYGDNNTRVAYTDYYTEMLRAKDIIEKDEYVLPSDEETDELTELKDKLIDEWGEAAVDAFLEWWDMDDLKHFEDAYIGCYWSGAKFAEEYACDGDVDRLPFYVAIDWGKTWDNIEGDYVVEDDYYFHRNW
jgi:hypothetical protein